ncbi:MAG TPA: hypothetical protein VH817_08470 [Thermoleophilaceae bacterium]|jgi:hypothetical protein
MRDLLVLEGKVIAREQERLGVMLQVPGRTELVYLLAAEARIFRALYPGLVCRLEIEDGYVRSWSPASSS